MKEEVSEERNEAVVKGRKGCLLGRERKSERKENGEEGRSKTQREKRSKTGEKRRREINPERRVRERGYLERKEGKRSMQTCPGGRG